MQFALNLFGCLNLNFIESFMKKYFLPVLICLGMFAWCCNARADINNRPKCLTDCTMDGGLYGPPVCKCGILGTGTRDHETDRKILRRSYRVCLSWNTMGVSCVTASQCGECDQGGNTPDKRKGASLTDPREGEI